MYEPKQHEMQLETTYRSGIEEWVCPTCERRLLLCWPPAYRKIIIVVGDEEAIHSGDRQGLWLDLSEVAQPEPITLEGQQPNLWLEWLEDVDFGDWQDESADGLSQTSTS